MFKLLCHDPVVLHSQVLDAVFAPARYPVLLDGVVDETPALFAGWETTLLSELFPLGFDFLLGAGLLSRQHGPRLWHLNGVFRLLVFENFAVGSMLCLLLMLKFKQSTVDLTNVGTGALRELLLVTVGVALDILVQQIAQVKLRVEFDGVRRI